VGKSLDLEQVWQLLSQARSGTDFTQDTTWHSSLQVLFRLWQRVGPVNLSETCGLTNLFTDFRRYFRPFFLDPKTSQPTSWKIYYDIFSYLATQLAFSFTTTPFLLLTLPASFLVWTRVYFYAVVGTALSMAFFASPAKGFLIKKLNKRSGVAGTKLPRTQSQESLAGKEPVLGLPDPQEDFEEVVLEVKAGMKVRERKGIRKAEALPASSVKRDIEKRII